MSEKYTLWLLEVSTRDRALITLAIMAGAMVTAWVVTDRTPPKYRPWVKGIGAALGLALFIFTLFSPLVLLDKP